MASEATPAGDGPRSAVVNAILLKVKSHRSALEAENTASRVFDLVAELGTNHLQRGRFVHQWGAWINHGTRNPPGQAGLWFHRVRVTV